MNTLVSSLRGCPWWSLQLIPTLRHDIHEDILANVQVIHGRGNVVQPASVAVLDQTPRNVVSRRARRLDEAQAAHYPDAVCRPSTLS